MESSFVSVDALPQPSHLFFALYFALFFVAAKFFFDNFLFRRFARWLLSKGHAHQFKPNKATKAKVAKCSESMWKLTYYATVEVYVLWFVSHESWFTNTKECFQGWPNQQLKFSVMLYYMCQCGFYLYSIVALPLWETRRKDFGASMLHHVITVFLLGCSYITGFFRIGTVILALHDASDVFLETAKVFNYSDNEIAASVCFGLFSLSWLVLRLIFYPFWIIRTTSYDFYYECVDPSNAYHKFGYYVFNTLLLVLLMLHIYWWFLICAMIKRQLQNKGKVAKDVRSDSEDDE